MSNSKGAPFVQLAWNNPAEPRPVANKLPHQDEVNRRLADEQPVILADDGITPV